METIQTFCQQLMDLESRQCTCSHGTICEGIFTSKQITVLEHPPYSPDLAPRDFFLFPKIKEIMKERYFDNIDDIRSNTMAALKAIPQKQFQNCFEGWIRLRHWCIASQGEYFEGDHSYIQQ
jgi:hypothetical protein